jgi:hypothetical protein
LIAALTTDGRVEVSGLLTPSTDGTPTGQSTTLDPAPDGAAIPGVVVVLYLPACDVDPSEVMGLIAALR